MKNKHEISMTSGSLAKNILLFSLPLMMSQILEVLFNLSDIAVAGKFADYRALGSVGSTTLLVSLFTGFLIGLGSGINVCVAHKLGLGDEEGAKTTVCSSALISLIVGLIVGVICNLFAEPFLKLLGTKDELIDGAVLYLKIYSLGMPIMAIYNFGNGVLSAAGVLNVILNLFFVIVCHRAADGVAIASVMAQTLSAFLVVRHLLKRTDGCALKLSRRYIKRKTCMDVLGMGIPAGIQNAIFAVANLFVQSGVNTFDAVMVSGNSAAANADTLIYNVMAAFHTACASFVSRNWGAGNRKRMMKSYLVSLSYSFISGAVLGGLLLAFGTQFLSFFANEPEVIAAGMERIKIMGWSYAFSAFMDCTIAASRGMGKSVAPTVIVILGSCVFRVIWVYTIFAYFGTISSLYLLYIFSWTITAAAEIFYFLRSYHALSSARAARI